jgi:hypothetical protein
MKSTGGIDYQAPAASAFWLSWAKNYCQNNQAKEYFLDLVNTETNRHSRTNNFEDSTTEGT